MTVSEACLEGLKEFFSRGDVLDWGLAPARPTPHAEQLKAWVGKGYHGSMEYMAKRLAERSDPAAFHTWARTAVMFSLPYLAPLGSSRGPYRVAAYAHPSPVGMGPETKAPSSAAMRGTDYHDRARAILGEAEAFLRARPGLADVRFYGFVDTAPVFERDLASEAGLGWRGKNGCTLSRRHGSAFNLAGFLLDVDLPASEPVQDFCGGCTRCIDLCPTGAFEAPGVLDATKCISYWTIEARGEVPEDLSGKFGGWVFGCDVCQEVCPWNHKHKAENVTVTAFPADAAEWLAMLRQGGGFQSRYKRSPLTRAGRRSLLRNMAIAARNLGDNSAAPYIREILGTETDPALIRELERTLSALEPPQKTG